VLSVALLVGVLGAPGGAPATGGVLWQGPTPEDEAAFAAAVGRQLRIPFEAAGPLGSSVKISAAGFPAGARLRRVADAPARAILRWRPSPKQAGEWTLSFRAGTGNATAPRLTVYVHVGRRAARRSGSRP
jgi:hypothetical protein